MSSARHPVSLSAVVRFARLSFFALVSCFFSFSVLAADPVTVPVGATPGEFMVDTMGGANYDIPIVVPPGVAGMEPMLSLNYSSQGGDGLAGIGWSLGGLSSISRCPRTIPQDDSRGSVNFDANDRFCLEGQRLILVYGTYGATGSEYRTELDGYSKIVAYGQVGAQGGPQYFKVWSKSGQVMEYGNTPDSFIEQGHPGANVWAVNKITDVVGNFLTVTYSEDGLHYVPRRIDYAGNIVYFLYEARTDLTTTYMAGSPILNSERLTTIRTYVKLGGVDTTVREYRLSYDTAGSAGRSRLTSLRECTGSGVCLPPTLFSWSTESLAGWINTNSTSELCHNDPNGGECGNSEFSFQIAYPDINGDSLPDVCYLTRGNSGTNITCNLGKL